MRYVFVLLITLIGLAGQVSATPPNMTQSDNNTALLQHIRSIFDDLAKQQYPGPDRQLPDSLVKLDYDAYRKIVFKHAHAIPVNNVWLELFHRGYLFHDRVVIHVKSLPTQDQPADNQQTIKPIQYSPQLFRFHDDVPEGLTDDLGFAGFRLLRPHPNTRPTRNTSDANQPSKQLDEFISFLGASYFRAVDECGAYGSSARGLAVSPGIFDKHEEFPVFTQFWLLPDTNQHLEEKIRICALMESPSITGLYLFTIHVTQSVTVDVKATLQARKPIDKLGIAPITSMFLYGEAGANDNVHVDHRPEVHDADGLQITIDQSQQIWHPLANPHQHRVTRFPLDTFSGFGLVQRDKDVSHYKDHETYQHVRPSIWVSDFNYPHSKGQLELLELASNGEGMDNIGVYWLPDIPLEVGRPFDLSYRLTFTHHPLSKPIPIHYYVQDTRYTSHPDGSTNFVITFTPQSQHSSKNYPAVDASVTMNQQRLKQVFVNHQDDGLITVRFTVPSDTPKASALRAHLFVKNGTIKLSEIWSFTCPTPQP